MTGTASKPSRPRGRALIALFAATAALAAGTAALAPAPAAAVTSEGGDCFTLDTLLFQIECEDLNQGGGLGSGGGAAPAGTAPGGDLDQRPYRGNVPVGNGAVEPYKGTLTQQELIELGVLTPDGKPDLGFGPWGSPAQRMQLEDEGVARNANDPECQAILADLYTAYDLNDASELPDYSLENDLLMDRAECLAWSGIRHHTKNYGKRKLRPRPKKKRF